MPEDARTTRPSDKPPTEVGILVTSYRSGAEAGFNLGFAGYSYDFVVELFVPLLERYGKIFHVHDPMAQLEQTAKAVMAQGLEPIHISFLPFQDITICKLSPNVVVPAWEFPDIPNHEFDGNPQNNWLMTAARCDMILVGGPFTESSFRNHGIRTPIRIVQIPTPDEYFELAPWDRNIDRRIQCPCRVYPHDKPYLPVIPPVPKSKEARRGRLLKAVKTQPKKLLKATKSPVEAGLRWSLKAIIGDSAYRRRSDRIKRERDQRRKPKPQLAKNLLIPSHSHAELSGIVYTSILNPNDGRKNWVDLLTAFLLALGDCEEATLIIKLISSNRLAVKKIVDYYQRRDIPHRCRVVFIADFLSNKQMIELADASTYYFQTTKAEGNCLPLMNFMAAGRPGISPRHSAMEDYFDEEVGFVIESHPEPAAWPHDKQLRIRTYWNRVVWPSVAEKLRESYQIAQSDQAAYRRRSDTGRERMKNWASCNAVWPRLSDALDCATAGCGPVEHPRRNAANETVIT